MEIIIEETKHYGKLMGGCNYAGFPIDANYRIKFGPYVYVNLNACMVITESLDYEVIFDWGSAGHWNQYKYRFSGEEFKKHMDNPSFLGIGLTEDIITDDPILEVGELSVLVTDDNREQIYQFLNNFKVRMKALSEEIETYYHNHEDLIKR